MATRGKRATALLQRSASGVRKNSEFSPEANRGHQNPMLYLAQRAHGILSRSDEKPNNLRQTIKEKTFLRLFFLQV